MSIVKTYTKKPVEVEAVRWIGGASEATAVIDWVLQHGGTARYHEDGAGRADPECPTSNYHNTHHYCPTCDYTSQSEHIAINTLEGTMRASVGDYVVKGVEGEFYPVKPGIFAKTFDRSFH